MASLVLRNVIDLFWGGFFSFFFGFGEVMLLLLTPVILKKKTPSNFAVPTIFPKQFSSNRHLQSLYGNSTSNDYSAQTAK